MAGPAPRRPCKAATIPVPRPQPVCTCKLGKALSSSTSRALVRCSANAVSGWRWKSCRQALSISVAGGCKHWVMGQSRQNLRVDLSPCIKGAQAQQYLLSGNASPLHRGICPEANFFDAMVKELALVKPLVQHVV